MGGGSLAAGALGRSRGSMRATMAGLLGKSGKFRGGERDGIFQAKTLEFADQLDLETRKQEIPFKNLA